MAKLVVTAHLTNVYRASQSVEIDIDPDEYRKADGTRDEAAAEEAARDILFDRLISWDWKVEE